MKKGDVIICIAVLLAGLSFWILGKFYFVPQRRAAVELDGRIIMEIDLLEDGEYDLSVYGVHNILTVSDREIYMSYADCNNQVCVHHAPISKQGEAIICLPHKLVVYILSGEEGVDATAY